MNWSQYLSDPYWSLITQPFANPDPITYPQCGYHIGVDHGGRGKTDIPIYMPCDGRITRHTSADPYDPHYSKTLGNCAIILSKDENWAFRFPHMRDLPVPEGYYRAGAEIGTMGMTGLATGIHCHAEAWRDGRIVLDKLHNLQDVLTYLVDAHKLVKSQLI